MIVPVILAGGSGTRLWPLSRSLYPKQLIKLVNNHTLFQNTVRRLEGLTETAPPIVVCNTEYRFMVADQLRQMNISADAIILEPVGRNTAPAMAVAALWATRAGSDPVLLILPADHHIEDTDAFQKALTIGYKHAQADRLVTFGVVPRSPETGYGYIKAGEPISAPGRKPTAYSISAFVEKPDLVAAKRYVYARNYCWNSGMFMFTASKALAALEQFAPDMVAACRLAVERGITDLDFFRLDKAAFSECPADSIDYAIMEKTDKGAMVPMSAGWNDLGSWEALWQVGEKDSANNVIQGDVIVEDVTDSYLHAESRLVAAVGLKDHVVVETEDSVLIAPRKEVQEVKKLVDQLKAKGRAETRAHKRMYRPWGIMAQLASGNRFRINRLSINPGASISLQKHYNRCEHWTIVHGTALVTCGDKQFILKEDHSTYISAGIAHCLKNPGRIPLDVIEVQTGSYIGKDDVVREDIAPAPEIDPDLL
ncbi:mannose-1-phosphate guanylyltransferase/mannose-6-phosphate isomerase [Desulfosarcina sp. OttesenSCG-928-A07]|nr:mannose-1-phosphate guanylyltransferase/mannose-6-phosphate isomerase [Desulfosarcina sp. OttesenSCG-928-G17]MDL2329287.1 mannose-1-phosphate guanylyltransferase/mannose-6-phosphate isomerase [Desulfosarcina sp. OttesenSCG-928-A07]